ncbi:hypothetical protein [Methylobacterium sp. A54F]
MSEDETRVAGGLGKPGSAERPEPEPDLGPTGPQSPKPVRPETDAEESGGYEHGQTDRAGANRRGGYGAG